MRAFLSGMMLTALLPQPAPVPAIPATAPIFAFHHLHLTSAPPAFLIEFYERLFDPAVVQRIAIGDVQGLQAGATRILVSPGGSVQSLPTALWHFGWGGVSLGETYLAHARREVVWEPPLPAERMHFHLRSVSPRAAAAWYGDVLGARVDLAAVRRLTDTELPAPEHRRPAAMVRLGEVALTIYDAEPPLFSTVGQQNDHVAFACPNLDDALAYVRAKGAVVLRAPSRLGGHRVALIEGPDQIAIELVESGR